MNPNDTTSTVARITEQLKKHAPKNQTSLSLLVLAVGLHLFVDVPITLRASELESNPIVLAIGFEAWIILKVVLSAALIAAFYIGHDHWSSGYVIGLGALSAIPVTANLIVLGDGPTGNLSIFLIGGIVAFSILLLLKTQVKSIILLINSLGKRHKKSIQAIAFCLFLILSVMSPWVGFLSVSTQETSAASDVSPTVEWNRSIAHEGGGVTVDDEYNVYATSGPNDATGYVYKFDSDGNELWNVSSASAYYNIAFDDESGKLFVNYASAVSWAEISKTDGSEINNFGTNIDTAYPFTDAEGEDGILMIPQYNGISWYASDGTKNGGEGADGVGPTAQTGDGTLFISDSGNNQVTRRPITNFSNNEWTASVSSPGKLFYYDGKVYVDQGSSVTVLDASDGSTLTDPGFSSISGSLEAVNNDTGTFFFDQGGTVAAYNESAGLLWTQDVTDSDVIETYTENGNVKVLAYEQTNDQSTGVLTKIDAGVSVTNTPDISGTVTDQNGEPVENATVEIVGVDTTQVTADVGQTKKERAEELLKEASDPFPSSWDSDLELTGENGYFRDAGAEYVAVHRPEDWATPGWVSTVDLGSPTINPPAEEPITFSAWNPSKGEGALTIENTVDADLPGAVVERQIVIKRLDPFGDTVDTITLNATDNLETGIGPGARDHPYVTATLPAGVYEIHPKGASNTAYTIVVGNERELRKTFASDLEDRAGDLTASAKAIEDKLSSGKFTRTTVTTNESGYYSVDDLGSNTEVAAVTAYKIDGEVLTSLSNPSPQDMRSWVEENDYNGSVYFALEPERFNIPKQGADVEVRKFSTPPFPLLDDFADQWADFRDLVENETLSELSSIYDIPLNEWNKTQAEDAANQVVGTVESIDERTAHDLIDQWEEQNNEKWEEFKQELEDSERSEEQLRDDVRDLEQLIGQLRDTVEAEDPVVETPVGDGTVDFRQAFDADFEEEDVVAVWKGVDGSSTPIPDEYVSVNKRPGRGDEVVIEDYPLPEGSAGGTISVLVVGEDGEIGTGDTLVENPSFSGEIPELRSIGLSSLRPGPGESVKVKPNVETAGVSVDSVTVYDSAGNEINSSLTNGEATFTPSAAGTHHVRVTFKNSDGTFVEDLKVSVGNNPRDFPPAVFVKEGRLGVFALAGDEVDDARVKIDGGGSSLDITALVEPESGTNEVHYHLEDAPQSAKQDVTVRVIGGDSIDTGTSLSRHVGVYLHDRELDEDVVLYRRGSGVDATGIPIPTSGENRGGEIADDEDGGTVIKSYTSKNGEVLIEINNDPGFGERLSYRVRLFVENRDIPLLMLEPVELDLDSIVPNDFATPTGALA